jgi:hypothetical protein
MSSERRLDAADPARSSEPAALVLELVLDSGEPIGGFVGRAGDPSRLAFRGWVDLMSAVNSIRTPATDTGQAPTSH